MTLVSVQKSYADVVPNAASFKSERYPCGHAGNDYETMFLYAYDANGNKIAWKKMRKYCDEPGACWQDVFGWTNYSIPNPSGTLYTIAQDANGNYTINNFPVTGEFHYGSPSCIVFIPQVNWVNLVIDQAVFEYGSTNILNFN